MFYTPEQAELQRMRKRSVPDVVKQDGYQGGLVFGIEDHDAFAPECVQGFGHQVHSAQCMMKAGVQCAGINKVRYPQLLDAPEPLEIFVFNNIEDEIVGNSNKSVNWII